MINSVKVLLLIAVMLCGFHSTVDAQDDSYTMWENIMLTPDNSNLKALESAMRSHNQKYHSEGVYKATVFNIASGPNSGNIIWSMGPVMFKHMDDRPGANGHDEDWRDNVMPYIKKIQTIEYWSTYNDEYNNTAMLPPGEITHPIMFIRYWEVQWGQLFSINRFFERASLAVKAMDGENPWGVYSNDFIQGRDIGRHFATVSFYKDWKDFDTNRGFRKAFEKANGENSWQNHINMRDATFRNWWDEIWVYNKSMSGD